MSNALLAINALPTMLPPSDVPMTRLPLLEALPVPPVELDSSLQVQRSAGLATLDGPSSEAKESDASSLPPTSL